MGESGRNGEAPKPAKAKRGKKRAAPQASLSEPATTPARSESQPRARPGSVGPYRAAAAFVEPIVATTWAPAWLSRAAVVAAAAYLALVFFDVASKGPHGPERVKKFSAWLTDGVPRPLRYFTQIASLFPRANRSIIEYHAEGWSCGDKRWSEIDVRPWFPIDANDKENRFSRTLGFYSRERKTMEALEEFIVASANRAAMDGAARGEPGAVQIGGARFSGLHIPFPELGAPVARYAWHPLVSSPAAWKKDLYWTRLSKRRQRCKEQIADYDDRDVDEGKPAKAPKPDDAERDEGEP